MLDDARVSSAAKMFQLGDLVHWSKEPLGEQGVEEMVSRYGAGPLRVVGLRIHNEEALQDPVIFPVAVTVETKTGDRREFCGVWFTKKPV